MLYDPSKDYSPVGLNLFASAKYMEEHGHCKYLLEMEGKVCLQGALQAVIYGSPVAYEWLFDGARSTMMDSCLESLVKTKGITPEAYSRSGLRELVRWNNAKETTGQQVIDLFREAAELCKV